MKEVRSASPQISQINIRICHPRTVTIAALLVPINVSSITMRSSSEDCSKFPVRDSDQVFLWGLWAKVWEKDYDELSESWEEQGREDSHGPFKARLANRLAVYPNTLDLKVTIRVQPVGQRPLFFVEEEDHPLAIAQRLGMSMEETQDLVARFIHPDSQFY